MRKFLLLSAALLCAASLHVEAQDYTTVNFGSTTFIDWYGDETATYGMFQKVSANGKYAVGYDDTQFTLTNATYLWKRDNPKTLIHLNEGLNRNSFCDVSNDGIIVGGFEQRDEENSDEPEEAVCYPGYCDLEGNWTKLPVPANYSEYYAKSDEYYMCQARAITPDGKYIAGVVTVKVGESYNSVFGLSDIVYDLPALWTKSGDGYELTQVYTGLGKGSKIYKDGTFVDCDKDSVNYKQFVVWDISDDGRTIVGTNIAGSGGQNPVFIRDGVLYQVFDCGEENVDGEDESISFNGGICMNVDANGNIYGYYQDGDKAYKYFMVTKDDKVVFLDNLAVCGSADGTTYTYGSAGLPYVSDCSDDGMVVAGSSSTVVMEQAVAVPAIAYSEGGTQGIARPNAATEEVAVDYRHGGNLYVNGLYRRASIYDAAGKLVAQGGQGHAFNLSTKASGVYVVKVETAQGVKTFKVAR